MKSQIRLTTTPSATNTGRSSSSGLNMAVIIGSIVLILWVTNLFAFDWDVETEFATVITSSGEVPSEVGANWRSTVLANGNNICVSGRPDALCCDGYRVDLGGHEYAYLHHDFAGSAWFDKVSNGTGWTLEGKFRGVYDGEGGAGYGITVYDGEYVCRLALNDSGTQNTNDGSIQLLGDYIAGDTVSYRIRSNAAGYWTAYHVIRVTGKSDQVKVYLDNELVLQGTLVLTNGNRNLAFGAFFRASGVWDYFKYTTEGAFPPDSVRSPPRISALRSGQDLLVLCWPLAPSEFLLEATPSLNGHTSWSTVTNLPVIMNCYSFVTNKIAGDAAFYRLRQILGIE